MPATWPEKEQIRKSAGRMTNTYCKDEQASINNLRSTKKQKARQAHQGKRKPIKDSRESLPWESEFIRFIKKNPLSVERKGTKKRGLKNRTIWQRSQEKTIRRQFERACPL